MDSVVEKTSKQGSRASSVICALLLTAPAWGCARSPYELAPVEGVVTIDGAPFTEGKVMFAPIAQGSDGKAGRTAFGRLDAAGRFTLSTYEEGDGCVVGDHWITLVRLGPVDAEGRPVAKSSTADKRKFDRLAVPRKATVVAGESNVIEVALTGQEVAKYGVIVD